MRGSLRPIYEPKKLLMRPGKFETMKPRSNPKRLTQRGIADAMGISVASVSRALADDPLIARSTRDAVQQKASELGYVPDRAAQRLRTGKTNVFVLVLQPHEELIGFSTSLERGIAQALANTNYHLVVVPEFGDAPPLSVIQRIVENGQADGLLLSLTEPNDIRVRYLLEKEFPFVTHGRTELATPHAYVDYDNYAFAYEAVASLAQKDVTNLAIVLPPQNLMYHHHFAQGFRAACREFECSGHIFEDVASVSEPTRIAKAVTAYFKDNPQTQGLILPGDTSALAAMAALQDMGLIPSEDVHLVVKQTSGIFQFVRPQVPNVYEDINAAGFTMAEHLLGLLKGEPPSQLQTLVRPGA